MSHNRTALPGVANAPEPFLLRDSATPIPSIDMQAFLTIEQIFHLALTPEDEVLINLSSE